jgi:hypothetical protein
MRTYAAVAMLVATLAFSACGGSSSSNSDATANPATAAPSAAASVAAAQTSTSTTPAPGATTDAATAAAPPPSSDGASLEVTGIVGGVNLNGNVLEIKRLSGAAVREIAIDSSTVIRSAAGGRIAFSDIRVSDRIIADGPLNDRQDQLVATEITVQDVVPGAQPGG